MSGLSRSPPTDYIDIVWKKKTTVPTAHAQTTECRDAKEQTVYHSDGVKIHIQTRKELVVIITTKYFILGPRREWSPQCGSGA